MIINKSIYCLLGLLLCLWLNQASANLIFSAPPREGGVATGSKSENPYEPIATYLSQKLGQKVTYENPENWFNYQDKVRNDKYDIVFDGPHFISWRIAHTNHEVVARMPGPLDFVLIVKADNNSINTIEDLVAKSFCGIPPPNLGTMVILEKFRNPVRQPIVVGIRGGFPQVYEAFQKGRCQAATLRTNFFAKKLTDEERKHLKVIYKNNGLPNQGFSVGTRISANDREIIRRALLSPEASKPLDLLIKSFGKPDEKLEASSNDEYMGFNNLLEGVVFGWE